MKRAQGVSTWTRVFWKEHYIVIEARHYLKTHLDADGWAQY